MAFSGVVKLIKELVTGTPADTDYFVFGNSDMKKITLPNLKKVLGVTKNQEDIKALNSAFAEKFDRFHTYDIIDYQETDDKIKQVVDYYVEHNVDVFEMFFMRITLQKGATYIVNGYKHDSGYATVIVTGYGVKNPLYGRRIAGKWTWNTISVA